ncbi:MAG TPA: hypothetical protein VHV76_16305, partial [Mycobacteriales bacterium]|nr:hypothetical protein [Mycobacteriales bacterium]
MIGRVAVAGVLTGLASLVAALPVAPAAARVAGTVTATVVEQTSPVGPSGHLRPGYRVTRNMSGATCKSHSPETGDAYSCHVRYGFDPCWLSAKHGYVICLAQAYDRKVTRLHVARFVNAGGLGKAKPMPWGLQLANGVNTTLIPGTFGEVSGKAIHYSYNQFKTVLVGPID